jgi:DNA modification methylase
MRETKTEIKHGDCKDILADYPTDTFDLIVTSPLYADKAAA